MIKRILGKLNVSLTIIKKIKNWPSIFLNYLKIFHSKYLTFKFRNGNSIKIRNIEDKNDTSGISTVYEIFLINNYCRNFKIEKSDLVIDLGANIGIFSVYASQKAPLGKIYSYEPFKTHYNRLLDNIKLNNLQNVQSFNSAVCGKKGQRELFINKDCSGMHSIIFQNNSKIRTVVNCTTLKEIFEKNKIQKCDFLKIDCEGAEYEIIFNTPKSIFKKINKIALEFDNIDKERNCFELKKFLEGNNFNVKISGAHEHQGILYAKNLDFSVNKLL